MGNEWENIGRKPLFARVDKRMASRAQFSVKILDKSSATTLASIDKLFIFWYWFCFPKKSLSQKVKLYEII